MRRARPCTDRQGARCRRICPDRTGHTQPPSSASSSPTSHLQARDFIAARGKPGLINRVEFIQKTFDDFTSADLGSYDAITCVHVVQHVATDLPPRWLVKMRTYLRPGGTLAISTTWTRRTRGTLTQVMLVCVWFVPTDSTRDRCPPPMGPVGPHVSYRVSPSLKLVS